MILGLLDELGPDAPIDQFVIVEAGAFVARMGRWVIWAATGGGDATLVRFPTEAAATRAFEIERRSAPVPA